MPEDDGRQRKLLKLSEVANILDVTPEAVKRLITAGRLAAINVGAGSVRAAYRVAPEALEAFLKASTVRPAAAPPITRRNPKFAAARAATAELLRGRR